MVAPRGPCSLDISAISHGEPWGEAAAKLTGVSTEPVRGTGIPRELRALPCPPAPLGSWRRWKHSSACSPKRKRSPGFCSHLLLNYAMAPCNFPKAVGQFSSFGRESGPQRFMCFNALLACENRPKAERGVPPTANALMQPKHN